MQNDKKINAKNKLKKGCCLGCLIPILVILLMVLFDIFAEPYLYRHTAYGRYFFQKTISKYTGNNLIKIVSIDFDYYDSGLNTDHIWLLDATYEVDDESLLQEIYKNPQMPFFTRSSNPEIYALFANLTNISFIHGTSIEYSNEFLKEKRHNFQKLIEDDTGKDELLFLLMHEDPKHYKICCAVFVLKEKKIYLLSFKI